MMKYITVVLTILLFTLAACSPSESTGDTADTADTAIAGGEAMPNKALMAQLSDSYADALSVTGQLAVGTIQLEDGDLAVDEEQAAELLPLWEALQALNQSDTTAEIELQAVVKQIQETMTPQQIQAIADMALTSTSLDELQSSGALAMGGPMISSNNDSDTFRMPSGGGLGGGPGGDMGGGPPAGGDGDMGGGPPDGGVGMMGNMNEDGTSTLDEGRMQELMLTGMVVRLLQTKTGDAPLFGPGGGGDARMAAMTAISEAAGLDMADIQTELQSGKSLADIAVENGVDQQVVRTVVQDALANIQLPQDQDMGTFIDDLLNGTR